MAIKPTDDDGWGDAAGSGADAADAGADAADAVIDASDAEPDEPQASKPPSEDPVKLETRRDLPPLDDDWDEADELAASVGVTQKAKKTVEPRASLWSTKGGRRLIVGALAALAVIAFVVTSSINSKDLYLVCGDTEVRAEQGRFFPWGRSAMGGDKWKPVEAGRQCADRRVEDTAELEGAMLIIVLERANENLSEKPPKDVERAAALLDQAELLSRNPGRSAAREEITSLRGDVEVWRAEVAVEQAVTTLESAHKRLLETGDNTRHVEGAGPRAEFLRSLIEIAKSGEVGTSETAPSASAAKTPGSEPKAEPAGDPTPSAGIDAGVPESTRPAPIPAGGVLL